MSETNSKNKSENVMRKILIDKITLNIGAGKDHAKLEKGALLLKNITQIDPVKTKTNKRLAAWSLRPGLPIGVKLTLRDEKAKEILKLLLGAVDNILKEKNFDNSGNFSFGIKEYIDIPGIKYFPDIGIMGLEVAVTLKRPGFRIKNRRIHTRSIPSKHRISKKEAIDFAKKNFNVKFGED